MECAGIIEEKREAIDSAKVKFLKSIKLPTDKIKKIDTDKEREKRIKNIARTIERWDTGKTKPPAGYSRRISAHEFKEWVEERENRKFKSWIIRIQRRLRNVSIDTLTEEELHNLMEQIR